MNWNVLSVLAINGSTRMKKALWLFSADVCVLPGISKLGKSFTREMIDVLRPATPGAILPNEIQQVIGAKALVDLPFGKELRWLELGS